ncbi:MAG: rhodanese-like domain-containing protein [Verrucomicrobiota bacterium]
MSAQALISGDSTMEEVLNAFPGARRALFRHFHIGGCASCAFKDYETLAHLCERNENLDVSHVIETIEQGHEQEELLLLEPQKIHQLVVESPSKIHLIDVRSREEYEAVKIEGSKFMDQELMQKLMNFTEDDGEIILIDHQGKHALDVASYLIGHGVKSVKCMRGGIDGWAEEVDLEMARYELQK